MGTFDVVNSEIKGFVRRISVANVNGGKLFLKVHRYAQIGRGDVIHIDDRHTSRISVVSAEDPMDLIRVSPHFEATSTMRLGEQEIGVRITEVITPDDVDAYSFLETFHY